MVSVIIPVYNVEKYIGRSIESVLSQTYADVEIVIIDDGSTDGTGRVCKEYAKDNQQIKYIYKSNEGQGVARTAALQLAQGKYITFLDGDDWLEPDAIEHMVMAVQDHEADIVVGDCYYVYDSEEGLDKRYSKIRYEDGIILCKGEHYEKINRLRTFTCAKLYRKEYLLSKGFSQPSYAYEDVATIPLLIAQAGRIAYISKPVYNYVKNRADSTIHNIKKQKDMYVAIRDMYRGFERLEDFNEYQTELKRMVWSQIRFMCIMSKTTCADVVNENGKKYEELRKLVGLMKELFPDFIYPDECNIEVVNDIYGRAAIEKIVTSPDNIKCRIDVEDKLERIVVSYNDQSKEYICATKKHFKDDEESWIWNMADEIFSVIWG